MKRLVKVSTLTLCFASFAQSAFTQGAPIAPAGVKAVAVSINVQVSGLPESYEHVMLTCKIGQPTYASQQMKLPLTLGASCKSLMPGLGSAVMMLKPPSGVFPIQGSYTCDLTFHSASGYVIANNVPKVFNTRLVPQVEGQYDGRARGTDANELSVQAPPINFALNNKCKV
jgi:hypothetical protein